MPPITVVIADQDKRRRAHFMHILQPEKGKGISVVGVARSGLEAMMAAAKLRPRILLLNLNLIKRKRNNLLPALRQNSPRTKVILLTRPWRRGRNLRRAFSWRLGLSQRGWHQRLPSQSSTARGCRRSLGAAQDGSQDH